MKTEILGVSVHDLSLNEAVDTALTAIKEHAGAVVVTPNPETLLRCRENAALAQAVNAAELSLPDGVGIVWAARVLHKKRLSRVPGADFAGALLERMRGRVFIFGGRPGVAESAARRVLAAYPQITACEACDGYPAAEDAVVARIAAFAPDFLLVCLGTPRQELFLQEHRARLNFGVAAGLGGTVDVLSGRRKRAPRPVRRLGLEWLWRAFTVPGKLRAVLRIPGFIRLVYKEKKWHRAD